MIFITLLVIGYVAWLWVNFVSCFLPVAVLYGVGIINLVTFMVYWRDKVAALNGTRRIPNALLLNLSVLCGWPGALIGQEIFRHKTRQFWFQLLHTATVVINLCVVYLLTFPRFMRHCFAI